MGVQAPNNLFSIVRPPLARSETTVTKLVPLGKQPQLFSQISYQFLSRSGSISQAPTLQMSASLSPAPTVWITLPDLAVGTHAQRFTCALHKQNLLQKSLPHLSTVFPAKAHFVCCPLRLRGHDAGGSTDFQLCVESRKPTGKYIDSGQGFFLSSFKAPASCSKFLMTTYHLKSSLALKEAKFDSAGSQDNLARK